MSLSRWITVHCEVPGCLQWGDGGNTPAEARAQAAKDGWGRVRIGRRLVDMCPRHNVVDRVAPGEERMCPHVGKAPDCPVCG